MEKEEINWYDKRVQLLEKDGEERYKSFIAHGEDSKGQKYHGTAHFFADELDSITDIEPVAEPRKNGLRPEVAKHIIWDDSELKPSNDIGFESILIRVKKVNDELSDKGATPEMIEQFWAECFAECDKQMKIIFPD